MKRRNLLAASFIAATFVVLALLPLTKAALRFDMQMAAGRPILSGALLDLGVRQADLPLGGIGPYSSIRREDEAVGSQELSVQLASAIQRTGQEKWSALQKLVATFPQSPAAHAALARMACKNGGSVGVGHNQEQAELSLKPVQIQSGRSEGDPQDAVILLRSCEAGEHLDPDNAYFPAMAAIAHLSANRDKEAQVALHRAASKPAWREYFEVEAQGRVRRAELLHGPQNSLTESATLASMLFPHYAQLRGMARVMTVQAMHAEQAGKVKEGLVLRQDVALLGSKMRQQSSSMIGVLVGTAMVGVAEQRSGGAALLTKGADTISRERTDAQFLAYLTKNGENALATRWQHYLDAGAESKAIVQQASFVSAFGAPTLFQSQWKLLTSQVLLGVATLFYVLGGLSLLRPWLGERTGRAASIIAVLGFVALLAWGAWQAVGNLRDILAFGSVIQGLSGDGSADSTLARAQAQALNRTFYGEGALSLMALLLLPLYLSVAAIRARHEGISLGQVLRCWTLPLAAVLTLCYGLHLVGFSLRERTIRAELDQVISHEGRYVAAKLGKVWPD